MKTKDIAVNRSSAIDVIFEEYMRHSPEEEGAHKLLSEQLSKQSDIELRRDINTIGHVVVTAFVIDKDNKRILCHRSLPPRR